MQTGSCYPPTGVERYGDRPDGNLSDPPAGGRSDEEFETRLRWKGEVDKVYDEDASLHGITDYSLTRSTRIGAG